MYSKQNSVSQPLFETRPKKIRKWYQKWWGKAIIGFLTIFLVIFIASAIYIGKVVYLLRTGQITPQQLFGQNISTNQFRDLPTLATEDDPSFGPKDAKVVIVEFADFQCSACGRAYPVVKQILKDYGDRIRFVYRDFPDVNSHPQALLAAIAGQCAHEQGKFWEMYDKIFANQNEISEANLKTYAVQLGFNSVQFGTCLQSGKYIKEIEQDLQEGLIAGVDATPTFFINGVKVRGAIPLDVFQKIVVLELNR